MTKLEKAVQQLRVRVGHAGHALADDIIQAVREEEQAKFQKLVELAKSIARVSTKEPEHCKKGPCSDSLGCICGCKGCSP